MLRQIGLLQWDVVEYGTDGGPWYAASLPLGRHWYVLNIETGANKRIGPVRLSGTNYFDRAQEIARRRNREHQHKLEYRAMLERLAKVDKRKMKSYRSAVWSGAMTKDQAMDDMAVILGEERYARS
jgi:hypothetical protein